MRILALDLGTKTGWATDGASGVWNLKPSVHESAGRRYQEFRDCLKCTLGPFKIGFVVYEEVHAHIGVEAAHVYGGLVAVLQTVCLDTKLEYQGVGVGTIKKHGTGRGNAKKDDMMMAASIKFKGVNVIDDNHADALILYDYAIKALSSSTTQ